MQYDYIVYIGRFQPFHTGHESVVRHALRQGDVAVFVVRTLRHLCNH